MSGEVRRIWPAKDPTPGQRVASCRFDEPPTLPPGVTTIDSEGPRAHSCRRLSWDPAGEALIDEPVEAAPPTK